MNNTKLNPFRYGRPIPPENFIGREEEIRVLFSRIYNGDSTAVVGLPHIGKSSVLAYLADQQMRSKWLAEASKEFAFIKIDCYSIPLEYRPADFWREVTNEMKEFFPEITIQEQVEIAHQNNFGSFTLRRLFDLLARINKRAVLLIDRFDALLYHPHFNSIEFFGTLYSLSNTTDGLILVTASRLSVTEMNRMMRETKALKYFVIELTDMRLPFWQFREVEQLFDRILAGSEYTFSQNNRTYIKRVAGRHPYLVQVAAAALFESIMQRTKGRKLYERMDKLLQDWAHTHFDNMWYHLSLDMQRTLLVLAQSELRTQIDTDIGLQREYEPEIRWLASNELIERTDEAHCATWRGDHWRISARSFAEWIVNNAYVGSQDVCDVPQPIDRTKLRLLLSDHFDEGELRMLCFDLSTIQFK